MSQLTDTLRGLLKRRDLTAMAAAEIMGCGTAALTKILNEDNLPSDDTLKRIIETLPTNKRDRQEIIRAHLLDCLSRINASGDLSITLIDSNNAIRMQALMDAAVEFAELAEHLEQLSNLASRHSHNALTASGVTKMPNKLKTPKTIPYPKPDDEPLGIAAEDPPEKPKRKPPVSKN